MQPDDQNDYSDNNVADDPNDQISGVYKPGQDDEVLADTTGQEAYKRPAPTDAPIHWMASEYISGEKNTWWFISLGIVVVALIAADIFYLKAYTFSLLVVVMAFSLIVLSNRPSRQVNYTLSGGQGLYIGDKLYHFSEFKSFGVINDDGSSFIMLIPIKRFAMAVSIYFPQEVGEEIVDILGARLPMEDLRLDLIDRVVRILRL